MGIEPATFQLAGQCPDNLAKLPHTHTHAHTPTHTILHYTHTHTYTRTHTYLILIRLSLYWHTTPHETGHGMLSNQLEALNFDQVGHVVGGRSRTIAWS